MMVSLLLGCMSYQYIFIQLAIVYILLIFMTLKHTNYIEIILNKEEINHKISLLLQ